jgi:sialic acid synthase SpsE
MNSIESVRPTVEIMRKAGVPFALLHCTNVYPTPYNLVRLNAMQELQEAFPDAVIGLSDHTSATIRVLARWLWARGFWSVISPTAWIGKGRISCVRWILRRWQS